jgi:hypothetical protein
MQINTDLKNFIRACPRLKNPRTIFRVRRKIPFLCRAN